MFWYFLMIVFGLAMLKVSDRYRNDPVVTNIMVGTISYYMVVVGSWALVIYSLFCMVGMVIVKYAGV